VSSFERRIRRLVVVVAALGGAAVVLGLVPSLQMSGHRSLAPALDGFLVVPIGVALAYGAWLYGDPHVYRALAWPLVAIGVYVLAKLASSVGIGDDGIPVVWTAHATENLILAMLVATSFAIPIGLFADRDRVLPSARVVR